MSDDDLLNRSLQSRLASGDEGSHGDSACSSDQNGDSQHLIQVESQLVATAIALEGERNEVSRLNTHIELLEKEYSAQKRELESMTKTANKQKSEIKRLTRDNDSLRRDISRYSGIRKYTDDRHDSQITDNANKLVPDVSDMHTEFRDKITGIASSLIDTLDSCPIQDSNFTCVKNRRRKAPSNAATLNIDTSERTITSPSCNQTYSQVVSSSPTSSDTTSGQPPSRPIAARHREPSGPPPSQKQSPPVITHSRESGQPIPVVQLGIGRHHPPSNSAVSPGVAQRQRPLVADSKPKQRPSAARGGTLIIGTSLINGLGQRLNKLGMPTTALMYRGATVLVLQNRLKHILDIRNQPDRIVLQCGGNDAERQPAEVVSARIETLVHDIKRLSPSSDIVINKVPPRGTNYKVLNNIQKLNSCLDHRYSSDGRVHIIDVCPKSSQCFRKDLVHFHSRGSFEFAKQLAEELSNLYLLDRKMWI